MKLLQHLFIISIFFIFLNCSNEKKNDPMSIEIGDKKVELKLQDENKFIKYDVMNDAQLIFTNIDVKSSVILGRGISLKRIKDSIMYVEINYPLKNSKSDTLDILINFDGAEEMDLRDRTIRLPVKRN
ncbi:hypothetical protein [Flavobacterium orientale]|nr:hypothetical protein [Flavobacterium orientale]